jgi:asparagine synthase (glutamine-hydrolysing)
LRRELEQRGYRFRSRSDTETVLNAFLEWDTDCFARLRGMFAVALWRESDRRLVLARDRMGIKPLYIARRGEDLYFGSELKAILVHPEIERWLSLDGLDCYLSLNYVPAPWTLVEGIEKLLPGQWMEWRRGAFERSATGACHRAGKSAGRPETAEAELDRLLKQSVREHLLSDVPLGVWLSGGLDSSSLVHYAAEASGSRLKTFSITFHGRSFRRSALRAPGGGRYGTDHTELDLNPEQDLPGAIGELAYYCDEPNADSGALPVWFLSRLTKASATVALSGEGADELFGGYLMQRASLLAQGPPIASSGAAGDARRRAALAGIQRQDRIRIQAEAFPGRLPDAPRRAPMCTGAERSTTGKALPGSTRAAAGARFCIARLRGEICRPSCISTKILSSGQYPDQGGPHQHGACDRSAAAVSGSSDRGIRNSLPRA